MGRPERDWAWPLKLAPMDKLVLLAMAEMAKNAEVYASKGKLSAMTGITARRVGDVVQRLIAAGLVKKVRDHRIENGKRKACDYVLSVTIIGDAASSMTERHQGRGVITSGDAASSSLVTQRHPNLKNQKETQNTHGSDAGASKPVRSQKPKFDPAVISLPHGNALSAAWAEFAQHRREIRAPLTPTAAKRIVDDLASVNERAAVEALRKSVKHGWRGVFVDAPKDTPKVVPIRTGPVQPSEAERRMLEMEARMKGAA